MSASLLSMAPSPGGQARFAFRFVRPRAQHRLSNGEADTESAELRGAAARALIRLPCSLALSFACNDHLREINVGNFYTNVTLGVTDEQAVAQHLTSQGRSAFVSRAEGSALVVFERD